VSAAPPGVSRRSVMTAFVDVEEYALPLPRVHQVVPHAGLTHVPTAPPFVPGLVNLHGAAVPVVDLACRFGAAPVSREHRSVVVVQVRIRNTPTLVGFAIDRLGRVLHVAADEIMPPPALESLVAVEFLTGVFQGSEGRFVMCVDVDRLLGADEAAAVAALAGSADSAPVAEARRKRAAFLCFRVAGERYAVALPRLHEITPCGSIAPILGAPPHVLGATNVRGAIVPVIDLGRRHGLGETRPEAQSCLLIVSLAGETERVGLLVESIERLAQVPEDEVHTALPFGTRFPPDVVLGMVPLGGEFVPILDPDAALREPAASRASEVASAAPAGDPGRGA
jgi:chemotaxis signal transduction protein